MANVEININANLQEALKQVDTLKNKLSQLSKDTNIIATLPPDISNILSKYQQSISQINTFVNQLSKQIQQMQADMPRVTAPQRTTTGFFNRIRSVFVSGAPGGTSPNPMQANHASVMLFDTPQDVATFLQKAGFQFKGREVQTLANIGNRLMEGKPVSEQSLNALSNIIKKFEEQADRISDKLLQERKAYENFANTDTGKKLLSEIDAKFSSLDKVADYLHTLESDARESRETGEMPAQGESFGLGNILRAGGRKILSGALSALGPVSTMTSLAALGYATSVGLKTREQAGLLGMNLGILGSSYNNERFYDVLRNQARVGYYTTPELIQAASIQSLYGGQYRNSGAALQRDMLATQQLARGFGLDINQVAQLMGTYMQTGGVKAGQETQLANAIASALQKSGIDPRQFLQANQMLVQTFAQQVGNVNTKQIAALQVILDQMGKETGNTALMGTRGAQTIAQMNQGITTPGGGMFGEYAVLSAIEQAKGENLSQALWTQRKGLAGLSNSQLGQVLKNVWQKIYAATGGNKELSMAEMQDILHIQNPEALESILKATNNFTKWPSNFDFKKALEGTTTAKEAKKAETSGALESQKVYSNLDKATQRLSDATTRLAKVVSEMAQASPWGMVAGSSILGMLPSFSLGALFGNIFKGKGGGIGSILGKIFGKGASATEEGGTIEEAGGLLGKIAKGAPWISKVAPWLSIIAGASKGYDEYNADVKKGESRGKAAYKAWGTGIGTTIGGWGGAAAGAAIGSIFGPVGTVIGGIAGGIGGNLLGEWAGRSAGSALYDATRKKKTQSLWDEAKDAIDEGLKKIKNLFKNMSNTINQIPTISAMSYNMSSLSNYTNYALLSFGGMRSMQPAFSLLSNNMFSGLSTFSNAKGGPTPYESIFAQAAATYGVPEALLKAVAKNESGFNPYAKSSSGAMGIMQLMPGTAKALGVINPYDPAQNIMAGAKYLSELLQRFKGNVQDAVAAYNAGPGTVEKYGGIPPYRETQNYVKKVMQDYIQQMSVPTGDGTLSNYEVRVQFVPKKSSPAFAPGVAL